MLRQIFLLSIGAVALGASGLLRADIESALPDSYLVELHLHGPLSEGYATMRNHAEQALLAGYDGLWWSDHQARASDTYWPLSFPLDSDLSSSQNLPAPNLGPAAELATEGEPGLLDLTFRGPGAVEGDGYLRVDAQAPAFGGWRTASLDLSSVHRGAYRSPLFAEPEFRGYARVQGVQGDAGCLLRVTLSGEPDGVSEEGTVQVMEFVPGNFNPPPAGPGVTRVNLNNAPLQSWLPVRLRPHEWIDRLPGGGSLDASMLEFQVVFFARNGGRVVLDFDDIIFSRTGPTGAALFDAQRQFLEALPPQPLFHYVGSEVEGPYDQPQTLAGSRDHLIALLPLASPPAFDFPPGDPISLGYPTTSIQAIQALNGAAILAHPFGTRSDGQVTMTLPTATAVGQRVRAEGAWGADGLEVGYPVRGRVLEEHVALWDALSEDGVFITGVGSSDNHDMQPWSARGWQNWASWIIADSDSREDLIDAVRAGRVFFGDPFELDPDGTFLLDQRNGQYSMGAVVPITSGQEFLRVQVDGAPPNCDVVMLLNGSQEVHRRGVGGNGSVDTKKLVSVSPGDWVRAELRDAQDKPIAFTNPVYYVGASVTPPPHRAP